MIAAQKVRKASEGKAQAMKNRIRALKDAEAKAAQETEKAKTVMSTRTRIKQGKEWEHEQLNQRAFRREMEEAERKEQVKQLRMVSHHNRTASATLVRNLKVSGASQVKSTAKARSEAHREVRSYAEEDRRARVTSQRMHKAEQRKASEAATREYLQRMRDMRLMAAADEELRANQIDEQRKAMEREAQLLQSRLGAMTDERAKAVGDLELNSDASSHLLRRIGTTPAASAGTSPPGAALSGQQPTCGASRYRISGPDLATVLPGSSQPHAHQHVRRIQWATQPMNL